MMNREERRNVAKLTIKTDNMYYMGLDVPYDDKIEVLMNGVPFVNPERLSEGDVAMLQGLLANADVCPVFTATPTGFTYRASDNTRRVRDDENGNWYVDMAPAVSHSSEESVLKTIEESGMIENPLLFKRWVCAQTFRMLNYKSRNGEGWDTYMRERLTYKYQFDMLRDEVYRLSRMEKSHGHDFEVESKFWTFSTIYSIYMENINKVKTHMRRERYNLYLNTVGGHYLHITKKEDADRIIGECNTLIRKFRSVRTYKGVLNIMDELKVMPLMPSKSTKLNNWKSIYRGYGGFYTLYNLFGWHGVTLKDKTMEESILYIEDLLEGDYFSDPWKFHYLLKEVIEENDFNLSKSIAKVNRHRMEIK